MGVPIRYQVLNGEDLTIVDALSGIRRVISYLNDYKMLVQVFLP
jgi:hypothetical protein